MKNETVKISPLLGSDFAYCKCGVVRKVWERHLCQGQTKITLPLGYKHTHTITKGGIFGNGGIFGKDKPTKCDYCETESYWREQIAQEMAEKLLLLARYSNKDELNLIRYEEAANIARRS